jgi:hypothetical protein
MIEELGVHQRDKYSSRNDEAAIADENLLLLQVTRAAIFLAFIPNSTTSHQLYIVHRGYDVD